MKLCIAAEKLAVLDQSRPREQLRETPPLTQDDTTQPDEIKAQQDETGRNLIFRGGTKLRHSFHDLVRIDTHVIAGITRAKIREIEGYAH